MPVLPSFRDVEGAAATDDGHRFAVGLGLDTAAEIGVIVLVGAGVATGPPRYAVLVLPLLFVAGMDPDRVRRCAQSAGPVPTNPSV